MSEQGLRRNVAGGGRPVLRPAGNTTPEKSPAAKLGTKQQREEQEAFKLSSVLSKPDSPIPASPASKFKHRQGGPGPGNGSPNARPGLKLDMTSRKTGPCPGNGNPNVRPKIKPGMTDRGHVKGGGACKSPRSPVGRLPRCCNVANTLLNKANGSLNASSCSYSSVDSSSCMPKQPKQNITSCCSKQNGRVVPHDSIPQSPPSPPPVKNRCPWITSHSDPAYVTFHDNEWGVPVHDDKRLFELLVLSGALAELSWSSILSSRDIYRQLFAGFDPVVVATFDDEKIKSLMYIKNSVLHEGKLLGIVNNAKLVLEIMEEFGSFDTYMWSFVGYKPMVNRYRYPRQVPTRIPKAEVISKDLLKRGFRFVGPTVVYSFMQVVGMTNDHLVHCFRWEECFLLSRGLQVAQYKKIQTEEFCENEREVILSDEESLTNSHQDS